MNTVGVGSAAPAFTLTDQNGKEISLKNILEVAPAMLIFYPGDFTMVCTKQLCNYRDHLGDFVSRGVQLVGISANAPEEHAKFAKEYDFSFLLLSDPEKQVAREYGCTSLLMFGGISRAVFIVSRQGRILYKYVEPTVLTRRKAGELVDVLKELHTQGQL